MSTDRELLELAAQQPAARVALTDEQARTLTKLGPVHCDAGGFVRRTAAGYRMELQEAAIRGIRIAERAHGITAPKAKEGNDAR